MAVKGLNILYSTAHFPYPPIGGDRLKQLKIIEYLAQNNKMHIFSLDRGFEIRPDFIDVVKSMNIEAHIYHLNIPKAYLSAAAFALNGKPLEINFFRHNRFKKDLINYAENNAIDLVISYFLRTAEMARELECQKLLISEDCRSFYQSRTALESKSLFQKAVRHFDARRLKIYESEITGSYNITTLVTDNDRLEMQRLNQDADIRVLSNGVDTEKFNPGTGEHQRKDIVFAGKLNMWVNILIVKRIAEEIFPGIKRLYQGAQLHIAGYNPGREVLKYSGDSINIHGNVEDMVPFLQNASVFIHPHLGGSGIQNKVLEAMACGCPVVTSPSGAWGFKIVNGINGFIAESNTEFIDYSVRLLENPPLVEFVGRNARRYIEDNHKWDHVFAQFENILEDLFPGRNL